MSESKTIFSKSATGTSRELRGTDVSAVASQLGTVTEIATPVKLGDLVQIRQFEALSTETKTASAQALQTAESDHWIYARVMESLPDGKLRVRVEHPANREHDVEKIVAPEDYRTKTDLARIVEQTRKLADAKPSTQNNLLAKHFAAQHARLGAE